ncbi:MAG: aspartyl/asparaginyl beta-hydroxylase domain-containing protein [Candidatus Rokubacteria bacterium]|nr:aspartyl/asparaginyl beta-hydroxylase domain-containing protein [Candidatus Rokubacteria bacterium]
MFHAPSRFPFAAVLEQHWRGIYDEYLGITGQLVDWVEKELYDEGWKVFALFDFPHGRPVPANVAKCPQTASLVERHVARHGAAGFSLLTPKTRIRAHEGYQGEFLRCHLGLKIPAGDCGLRVRGDVRRWEPGKVLIFDDRVTHESWNLTDEERVVLLIDFVPDA